MIRKGSARWSGTIKEGSGTVSTPSGTLNDTPYSFTSRFEDGSGTNPEELLAAAHAGCFTMAFSLMLTMKGFTPGTLSTNATLTMERQEGGFTITKVYLDLVGAVPGIDDETYQALAAQAKANCPVSKLFNAEITLSAKLEGELQ